MIRAVKWSCSCRGLLLEEDGVQHAWVIEDCRDQGEYGLHENPHNLEKTTEPLGMIEMNGLLLLLKELGQDGHRFRTLRDAMGPLVRSVWQP